MSRWSIRFRVVAVLVVGVVLALGAVSVFVGRGYRNDADRAAAQALTASRNSFAQLRNRDTVMLMAVLDTLISRPDVRDALAKSDRRGLEALCGPLFSDLKSHYGITHLLFIAPDGTVILRAHKPSQFGDKLTRQTLGIASATGSYGAGLEFGQTAFALRVVHPVYASAQASSSLSSTPRGQPIAYMEVGEEIGHFLDIMRGQTRADHYALLIPKSALTHPDWSAYRAGNNQPDNWDEQPLYVVDASTSESITAPVVLDMPVSALRPAGVRLADRLSPSGSAESVAVFPVFDAAGRASGVVVDVHDTSGPVQMAAQTQTGIVAAVAIAALLLSLAMLWMLNALVFNRLRRLAEVTQPAEGVSPLIGDNSVEPAASADEIERFEARLSESRRELLVKSELLDAVTDVIYVHDLDGRILYANKAAETGRGYTHGELLGMRLHELVSEGHHPQIADDIARIVREGEVIFESTDVAKNGTALPVEVHASVIDIEGHPAIVSVVRDVTERKKAETTIERLAYFDPLTGAANRRLLQDRLGVAMALVKRSESSLAVVFIDVDRLKPINDTLGHPVGDQVLQTVADRLSQLTRQSDTVARVGGDEFVLLLGDTDEEGAARAGERLLEIMAPPINVDDRELRVSISAGVVVYHGGDRTWERLIQEADLAMYSAKQAGRNRYHLFEESMVAHASERFNLQQDLANAFDAGQLRLYYQPQVSLADGAVIGAEALCRWLHPTRGHVAPDEFIPLAEESGLLVAIGRWAIYAACQQIRDWQLSGLADLHVAVNVSASQIVDSDLLEVVRAALDDSGIDPSRLALEIGERIALGGTSHVLETLRQLAELGVRLVVDDFGVGYSALGSIAELPVSSIKVNRAFVAKMGQGSEAEEIVRNIIDLGVRLSLETVAVGVESAEQLVQLGGMGCSAVQGFYFAPALPPAEFEAFARGHRRAAETRGDVL